LSWSDRRRGGRRLRVRTYKTVPWRRARYKAHLDEADALR
jgi:hypothetical protein